MSEPIITIKNLDKIYPKKEDGRRVEVFHDIDLTVHKGEFLVLLGPSGCGKSTFLRILAGLDEKTHGEITYGPDFNFNKISFVFQNFGILPWLSVFQNVELNLIGRGVEEHERAKTVDAMLHKLGLFAFRDNRPHDLSGGMKQRVGLARAFVTRPEVIFLDEPFSELDFFTAESLRNTLLDLWKETGCTIVMVSHYIDEAVHLSDRIEVFSDRPSKIIASIKDELPRPRDYRSGPFFAKVDEVLAHFAPRG